MGKGRFTPQSTKFCELMAKGDKTQYECYIEAYPVSKSWTKGSVQTAASMLMKKPHIREKIDKLKNKIEEKLLDQYVWDKDKSTRALMRTLSKIERNVDVLADSRDELLKGDNSPNTKIKNVSKVLYQMTTCAKAIKELAGELNSIYGLNKTNVEVNGTMQQVVFEGEDDLPPDEEQVDNEGNELVEEDFDGEDTEF